MTFPTFHFSRTRAKFFVPDQNTFKEFHKWLYDNHVPYQSLQVGKPTSVDYLPRESGQHMNLLFIDERFEKEIDSRILKPLNQMGVYYIFFKNTIDIKTFLDLYVDRSLTSEYLEILQRMEKQIKEIKILNQINDNVTIQVSWMDEPIANTYLFKKCDLKKFKLSKLRI